MIDDFDIEELEELFAEFEIEAGADPGPDKYDAEEEDRKRKLMEQLAFYAEEGPTWDPEGKYLCGSCLYREMPDVCYSVEGKISMTAGSCQFYYYGNPDPETNPLPMKEKYTQAAANYAERPKAKGFGCYPRCEYGSVAEGKDKDGREIWCGQFGVHVRPKACCAFEDGNDLVQIEAGGEGSGCDPETAAQHGTKCGPHAGEKVDYMAEKIGGAQGTNPGGMYKGSDGKYRYVKLYGDGQQSRGEFLANRIYNDLYIMAPTSVLFKYNGKDAIASEQLEGKTFQQLGGPSSTLARQFLRGFAADVLTANWDAVGTGMDNAFVDKTGDVYRIDNGGTFLKRAQGGNKPDSVLNQITEVKGFFEKNPYYAKVGNAAAVKSINDLGPQTGTKSFVDQVTDIVQMRDNAGGWQKYVSDRVPDMPADEQKKVVGMLEARTDLMKSLALGMLEPPKMPTDEENQKALESLEKEKPSTGEKTPAKGRDWSTPNPNLVGGYFRQGTVLAQVYTKLSQNEGQWQKISEIKKDLEAKLGKPLYNISQNTLKQGGKKSGKWQLEISGDSIRMFVTKAGEKTTVAEVTEDKQQIVQDYAAKFAKLNPNTSQDETYKEMVGDYFTKMGVPIASQKAYRAMIDDWAGSSNGVEAQNFRQIGMDFYHREPSGEYTGGVTKVFDTPKTMQQAKLLEPAAMAMKALSGAAHVSMGTTYVYRNIVSKGAADIVKDIRAAMEKGDNAVKIPFNSVSSWSTRAEGGYHSGQIKVRMKVDPESIWASYRIMPYEFLKGEQEVIVGVHQPKEIFSFKDISFESTFAGADLYQKFKKNFATMQGAAEKPEKEEPLRIYDGNIPMFDSTGSEERKKIDEEEKKKKEDKKKK